MQTQYNDQTLPSATRPVSVDLPVPRLLEINVRNPVKNPTTFWLLDGKVAIF
jgi:hypothetical protein